MKLIKESDYTILNKLISLKQKNTKKNISKIIRKKYSKVIETKDFLIAEGDIPIALVAHLDTVFEKDKNHKRDELFYDVKKGVMWNPYGAGFDDKAGVFAILKIISEGYRPHLIFTTDEELGGIGATFLTEKYPHQPFQDLKYIIELDRANESDCVFYDCYNKQFIDYVESFGFIEAWGSFSDIDVICPVWKIAGVNLSIGYKNEHSCSEILNINAMFKTIERVKRMLNDVQNIDTFIYIRSPYFQSLYNFAYDDFMVPCGKCKEWFYDYEVTPVKRLNGTTEFLCCDCLVDRNVEWCDRCGQAFERLPNSKEKVCKDCK